MRQKRHVVFAVGTRDNHDPGCRIYLNHTDKGFLPAIHVVFLRGVNFHGNFSEVASEKFLIQEQEWVTLSLQVDRKAQTIYLFVDGEKAIEKNIQEYGDALIAQPNTSRDFYLHLNQSENNNLKAAVEKVSAYIDQKKRELCRRTENRVLF